MVITAAKTITLCLGVGMLIGAGMRLAEWAIPAPKRHLEMHHSIDEGSHCLNLKGD